MAVARLGSVALDCAEPLVLAEFWAALLGGEIAFTSDDFVAVQLSEGWLATNKIANYQPPTWPKDALPKQMHLDLAVDDLDIAEAEAIKLGALKAVDQPDPERWRVLLDPAGHPFCITVLIPS